MGIVNTTPDSFSDGGTVTTIDAAVAHAEALLEAGADIIDIGGESTRPGATPVAADEELRRVLPVLRALRRRCPRTFFSCDTAKAVVAQACIDEGCDIINDVTALADPLMPTVMANSDALLILMHMRGTPLTMHLSRHYDDVVAEVGDALAQALARATAAGIDRQRIWLDPGLGFAKTAAHSWTLVHHLTRLATLGRPLVVGPSRKRFLRSHSAPSQPSLTPLTASMVDALQASANPGGPTDANSAQADAATVNVCVTLAARGAAVLRVHNVAAVRQGLAALTRPRTVAIL